MIKPCFGRGDILTTTNAGVSVSPKSLVGKIMDSQRTLLGGATENWCWCWPISSKLPLCCSWQHLDCLIVSTSLVSKCQRDSAKRPKAATSQDDTKVERANHDVSKKNGKPTFTENKAINHNCYETIPRKTHALPGLWNETMKLSVYSTWYTWNCSFF